MHAWFVVSFLLLDVVKYIGDFCVVFLSGPYVFIFIFKKTSVYKWYKKVGVLPIRIVWSNVTLDHTIRIGSTPTFLYFDLYLYSAYAAHYVYINGIALLLFFTDVSFIQFIHLSTVSS